MWKRAVAAAAILRARAAVPLAAAGTLLAMQHTQQRRTVLAQPAASPAAEVASAASASDSSGSGGGSGDSESARVALQSEEDQECPWCTAMTGGPCASEFVAWRNCSRRVQEEAAAALARGADAASVPSASKSCMALFRPLDQCVRTPGPKREYYRQILPIDARREAEPSVEEKQRDADSDRQ